MDTAPMLSVRPERIISRKVHELIDRFSLSASIHSREVSITGLAITTSQIIQGDLFFAVPGQNTHGAQYGAEAERRGAAAILTDREGEHIVSSLGVPVLVCENPRDLIGPVSEWFYATIHDSPNLLGVTGTNGKTSTTYFAADVIRQLGLTSGISSTTECRIDDIQFESRLTTPEACELHALVARMRESSVDVAIIEVSAQAVTKGRVDNLFFQTAGFTSFSQDHLDEYKDMESYFQAKKSFFTERHVGSCIVSIDSEWGIRLAREVEIPVSTISCNAESNADWIVSVVREELDFTQFSLRSPKGETLDTTVYMPSKHMAANAGLAIALLVDAGIDFMRIKRTLESGVGITAMPPGRMERVSTNAGPSLFVDAAHTPEAIRHTLAAIRGVTKGNLVGLVGAGGDRDKLKRFSMGAETGSLCDFVIVTDDNSRTEDPSQIRRTVLEGVLSVLDPDKVVELGENADAIKLAIDISGPGDAIVWLGPGSESYRDVGGIKTPFSARALARQALKDAGYSP